VLPNPNTAEYAKQAVPESICRGSGWPLHSAAFFETVQELRNGR
jgi:hypothetical protein